MGLMLKLNLSPLMWPMLWPLLWALINVLLWWLLRPILWALLCAFKLKSQNWTYKFFYILKMY